MLTTLLVVSTVLQMGVIAFALRQVSRKRIRMAWMFVALAFTLILARRLVATLAQLSAFDNPVTPVGAELLGICVSSLFLAAMIVIRPLLDRADAAERELRQQAEKLTEAVQARDNFISIASHELKTPLTPLSLRLQQVERELEKQPDSPFVRGIRALLGAERKQVHRLNELIGDLLDVSRMVGGHLELQLEEFELGAVAQEVAERYREQAAQEDTSLEVLVDGKAVGTWDRLRLEQVVTNLLDNALKYGAGKPVRLKVASKGNGATITVTDHGIGIDPSARSRIFDRFERAVPERHYGGLGLGLFIVREIVHKVGGTVSVVSEPGVETTFKVDLPLRARTQTPSPLLQPALTKTADGRRRSSTS